MEDDIELLDAHSLVWMLWLFNGDNRHGFSNEEKQEIIKEIEEETEGLKGYDRDVLIKGRVNQSVFRDMLLFKYKYCRLCPVGNDQMLVASHIKPWSESSQEERLDIDNGFLLCPNHDKLFDRGFITFDDEGKIRISKQLSDTDRIGLNVHDDMKIELTDGNRKYLEYHRDKIFKDGE